MSPSASRWTEFQEACDALRQKHGQGRAALRRPWTALRTLFVDKVMPHLSREEALALLGKEPKDLDPEENDLKALTALAVGRGLLDASELRKALEADLGSSPLYFLAGLSGKTFGETVAPEIVAFWLRGGGDLWEKKSNRELYDMAWAPSARARAVRIELKASSEHPEYRFQQVRDPRAGGESQRDYDALLCMGVTASTVEFWLIPSNDIATMIDNGTLTSQHGGQKAGLKSNTYWFVADAANRARLAQFRSTPEDLRSAAVALHTRLVRTTS